MRTLVRCRQLCHRFNALTNLFLAVDYNPSKVLRHFFPPQLYYAFRAVQLRTGAVVSGSTVLKLLSHEQFTPHDLDIYVDINCDLSALFNFLTSTNKFTYAARNTQHADLTSEVNIRRRQINDCVLSSDYSTCGAITVLDFYTSSARKIQVILCVDEPRTCLLRFHCTAVMNYITHDSIVCLYPRATLLDKVNCSTNGPLADGRLLLKYAERGWRPVNADHCMPHDPRFTKGELECWAVRSFQDQHCLSIRIAGNLGHGAQAVAASGVNRVTVWEQRRDGFGGMALEYI
ncbi:hypothetical protein BD626DRAFT_247434 [Schizophyllum amplum]|uniref:Uncharacterized protein n=1 Tax=Schizophyllum amplum TaxID=97359 RepID=A0A550BVC7_9AGAR|nr:hypothetical protein BD626DRAFT_247434 [Auriculariopsis ampla]